MIAGFERLTVRNKHGGEDPVKYADLPLENKAHRVDVGGSRPALPTILPAKITKAAPKDSAAELKTIHAASVKCQEKGAKFGVDQVNHWADGMLKAAVENENAMLAPASKKAVKDMMRQTRRQIAADFKAKHFARYHKHVKAALEAVIPQIEKQATTEDEGDRTRLAAYGIEQTHPSQIVAGLLMLREYFIRQLVFTDNALENENLFPTLTVDSDLLRLLGVEI